MKRSKLLLLILSLFLIICIAVFPTVSITAARKGAMDCLNIILPSLLPFMIGSNIIMKTGILKPLANVFTPFCNNVFKTSGHFVYVFFASALSGYPMGAKLCGDLLNEKSITHEDALRIINATSMSGPLFISGAVAATILKSPNAAGYIYFPHIISALLTGLLFGAFVYRGVPLHQKKSRTICNMEINVGKTLYDAILNAIQTVAMIGGFIILFAVITAVMEKLSVISFLTYLLSPLFQALHINTSLIPAVISGMLEMSNGCISLGNTPALLQQKILAATFIITFSGLSIFFQTISIMTMAEIKNRYFVPAKITQSILSVVLCSIALYFIDVNAFSQAGETVFSTSSASRLSGIFLVICLVILLLYKSGQRIKK